MKKLFCIYIIPLFCIIVTPVAGQIRQNSVLEKIQAKKVAFFNEKLQLTPNQSAEFWPVYNDYTNRKNLINQERNNLMTYFVQNEKNLSNKETSEILDKLLDFQLKETELTETYSAKFKEFLPDTKIIMIFVAEIQFKKLLLSQSIRPRPNTR